MTMLEKAAHALKAKLGEALNAKPLLGDATSGDWYGETGGSIECTELVVAVLRAIREPDEAMLKVIETSKPYLKAFDSAPEMFWGQMIDAILQPGGEN